MMSRELTPALLLQAYAGGIFPMAESRDNPEIHWINPSWRGILPLDGFHISRSLKKRILRGPFSATLNRDFAGVLSGCADRENTWINDEIAAAYTRLHEKRFAHSLEIWAEGKLAGGVYGVTLGGAFFGESMFSRRTDASKVALAYLVAHLANCGFTLFDTQFLTSHLASLGGIEISRAAYQERLAEAIAQDAMITAQPLPDAASVIQRNTHTS